MKVNYDFSTNKYAKDLCDGKIIACESEILLAERHIKDLEKINKSDYSFWFDESRAERYFKFYEHCINPETLEPYILLPHLKFDEGMFFGWVCKETGARRFTDVFDFQARGGMKSTRAGIKADFIICNDKIYLPENEKAGHIIRNARVDLMAVDKTQVKEVREPLVNIVNSTPFLMERIKAMETKIEGIKYGGEVNVLSSDGNNKQGGKPDFIVVDELSSFKDDRIVNDISKGLGKKLQYCILKTTTAGDDFNENPAKKEYKYAKKVLSGKIIADRYLPIIRELDKNDDIHNKENWQKACPVFRYKDWYQYSKTLYEKVVDEYNKAFSTDDLEEIRHFKVYRLNSWEVKSIDKYLTSEDLDKLDECVVSKEEFYNLTKSRKKNVGLDYSIRKDLTAYADVFKLDDGRIAFDSKGFIIDSTVEDRIAKQNIAYEKWIRNNEIITMDYDIINQNVFADNLITDTNLKNQKIQEVDYDPAWAKQLAIDLEEGKYGEKIKTMEIPQSNAVIHIPTDYLRSLIRTKMVVWNGNEALRWCFENCYLFFSKTGLMRIGKENKDSVKRIDMVAAIINGLARIEELKNDDLAESILSKGYSF